MNTLHHPAAVVQRQLDAYNARDIDALMATYADDARQFEHPATLLAHGAAQIRERMALRFEEPDLHARLVQRVVMDTLVIDHEMVRRNLAQGVCEIELVAIYEVRDGKIQSASVRMGKTYPA
jgi:hypothetical protein